MHKLYNLLIALLMLLLASPMTCPAWATAKERFTVVIDPGHGGGDAGTPHRKQKLDEKTVALNVALRLGKLIEAEYKDVKVVYTRRKDVYPTLPERTQIAKKAKGDLFISIHVNAAPDASARGFETYVFGVNNTRGADEKKRLQERMADERENLDINGKMVNFDTDIDIETKILCQAQREKHNKQSLEAANDIHQSIISAIKGTSYARSVNNRGVKPKNLFVLCYSPMPAILIELGYMSNPAEERFLTSEEGMNCFARGILNGFRKYKRDWEKRQLRNNQAPASEPEPEQPAKDNGAKQPATPNPATEPAKTPEAPAAEKPSKQEVTSDAQKPEQAKATQTQVVWKVQFLTGAKIYKQGAPELKGLWPVEYYKEGAVYKYTYGAAPTQKQLYKDLQKVKAKFKDAFPVKFDGEGNRIK